MSIKRHLPTPPTLKTPGFGLAKVTDSWTGADDLGNFPPCLRRVASSTAGRDSGRSAVSRPRWASFRPRQARMLF